jgi:hypothetical protein
MVQGSSSYPIEVEPGKELKERFGSNSFAKTLEQLSQTQTGNIVATFVAFKSASGM